MREKVDVLVGVSEKSVLKTASGVITGGRTLGGILLPYLVGVGVLTVPFEGSADRLQYDGGVRYRLTLLQPRVRLNLALLQQVVLYLSKSNLLFGFVFGLVSVQENGV